jgi:ferredoxin-NADP reductase/Na+-translocating ferredoxin:NAD+ oxidoreductase RnfD subunit
MTLIDRLLNHITMYRLVLYYTAALLAVAFGLGFFALVPSEPTALAFSMVVIMATCWLANSAFALLFRVPANTESIYITGIILALILPPVTADNHIGVAGLVLASGVAIASKFLLAIRRRHVFNPVAIGVVAAGLILDQPATWWVGGNLELLPVVLVGGLLVVRKVQRFDMIGSYIAANLIATLATTSPDRMGPALTESLIYSPLLFAGFAMLTEPLTAPQGKLQRIAFGVLVGALSAPTIHIGELYLTPEIAFLIGNLFAFVVSPTGRFKLTLLRIERMAEGCYDFVFAPDRRFVFQPGQYLDWTLHVRAPDDRGNRRPFTIASAPGEDNLRLGVKFYDSPSAFKRTLAGMRPGDTIYASHLAGHFTLPANHQEKLAFIAGGIGVTPFRSMVQDMLDRRDQRSVVMLYGNTTIDEIAYSDIFERAGDELDVRTVYAVAEGTIEGSNVHRGFIDEALIRREIPDYRDRSFYLSGPHAMVVRFQQILRAMGVARRRIHVDHFPGFA